MITGSTSESNKDYPPPSQIATRLTGAIRRLLKGYGFIAGDDGTDYYFHWSAMEMTGKNFKELAIQERVSFLRAEGPKGIRAVNIRVI